MEIRRAGPGDAELVAAIGDKSYRDHYSDIWSPAGLERWLDAEFAVERLGRELAADSGVAYTLMLDESGHALGFSKTIADQPVPGRVELRGRELRKIYFRRDTVGRGLGSALLEHVAAEARAAGEPLVWLDVLKTNVAGLRFYERHGFSRVGEQPWATDIQEIGMWLMVRRLR
jgi:ribosomal protein S18 acetylase RimI-like enzyme